jgi:hypothetical protein
VISFAKEWVCVFMLFSELTVICQVSVLNFGIFYGVTSSLLSFEIFCYMRSQKVNPLTPNALYRRRAVSPLKIKISSKNMREKPASIPIVN